jgi:hypothetical protein
MFLNCEVDSVATLKHLRTLSLHFARRACTIGALPVITLSHGNGEQHMQKHLAFLTIVAVLGAASGAVGADDKPATKDNTPPEGFTALFNGKDLTNWQALVPMRDASYDKWVKLSATEKADEQKKANEMLLKHWTVEDGALVYDGKGTSLQTAKDYGNFELYVDWKIGPKGDSGIYLRAQPQVQIWDSDTLADNLKEDRGKGSGGLWNNAKDSKGQKPLKKADKPIGEWNTFHIIMKGENVTVFLNGEKVVDDAPLANYWEKGKPLPATGPIELQHHGDKLWFKNIYIKDLGVGRPSANKVIE